MLERVGVNPAPSWKASGSVAMRENPAIGAENTRTLLRQIPKAAQAVCRARPLEPPCRVPPARPAAGGDPRGSVRRVAPPRHRAP